MRCGAEKMRIPAERGYSGGGDAGFDANVRGGPEIPALVIDADGGNIFWHKRNLFEAADFNDAAFAGGDLIEGATVLELDGDDLIAGTGFARVLQLADELRRNGNQT